MVVKKAKFKCEIVLTKSGGQMSKLKLVMVMGVVGACCFIAYKQHASMLVQ